MGAGDFLTLVILVLGAIGIWRWVKSTEGVLEEDEKREEKKDSSGA